MLLNQTDYSESFIPQICMEMEITKLAKCSGDIQNKINTFDYT